MNRRWRIFLRVLQSYSIEEKVTSIIVFGMVFFLLAQSAIDIIHPQVSILSESGNVYNESLINDKPLILNPLFVDFSEANRDISSLIFNGLTKYDPAKKAFIDDLATLSISDDKTTYHFTIKPNIKWHDGFALTVDDVYFTFHDIIQNENFQNPILKANFKGINITKIDDLNLEFKLQNPNSFFINNTNVGILPQHIFKDIPIENIPTSSYNLKPIGTGPYLVNEAAKIHNDGRQEITLRLNQNFYGEKAQISQIHFSIYPDTETLAKNLAAMDLIGKLPAAETDKITTGDRFKVMNYELPQYTALFFNTDSIVLKSDKMRSILAKSFSKNDLLKIFNDKSSVETPLFEIEISNLSQNYDPKTALKELNDLGYKQDANITTDKYLRNKKGEIITLNLLSRQYETDSTQDIETKKVTDFIKKNWEELGIKIQVSSLENELFLEKLKKRDYDMVLAGQNLGYNFDTYSYWHSTQATDLGLNLSNYKSFAADQIIEKIRTTFLPQEKQILLEDLAKVISKDIPAIFLYRPVYTLVTDGKVKGIKTNNWAYSSDRFSNIAQLCINCK